MSQASALGSHLAFTPRAGRTVVVRTESVVGGSAVLCSVGIPASVTAVLGAVGGAAVVLGVVVAVVGIRSMIKKAEFLCGGALIASSDDFNHISRRQCTLIALLEEARCAHLAATEKQKAVDHPVMLPLPLQADDSSGADEAAGFVLIVSLIITFE